jgi:hypothetical protein
MQRPRRTSPHVNSKFARVSWVSFPTAARVAIVTPGRAEVTATPKFLASMRKSLPSMRESLPSLPTEDEARRSKRV